MKYIGYLILSTVILYAFLVNFSIKESEFKCIGEMANKQGQVIYFRLSEARWWVGLWSDSDGSVWIEYPNNWVNNFNDIARVGDIYQIYESNKINGTFSTLSNALQIKAYGSSYYFEGTCDSI